MNELLQFKKGLYENLPQDITAGTVYVTTDEKAMYIDIDATNRIRLNDIVYYATLAALQADMVEGKPRYADSTLYYVVAENALMYFDSADAEKPWKQINDTESLAAAISELQGAIALKADQSALQELQGTVATKADQSALNTLSGTVATKADQSALETLQGVVDDKLDKSEAETTYATKEALQQHIEEIEGTLATADAMVFKGVLGGEGNLATLPAAEDTLAGDTYKIGANGTYAGFECYIGDLIVAKEDGKAEYYHVSSGYEDDFDPYLTADAENNKITLKNSIKADLGSISFETEEGSSLSITTTATTNEAGVSQTKVTLGYTESDQHLYWGSF